MPLTNPSKYAYSDIFIVDADYIPVINVWNTVFDVSGGIVIGQIALSQSSTEAEAEDLEAELTVDGTVVGQICGGMTDSVPTYIHPTCDGYLDLDSTESQVLFGYVNYEDAGTEFYRDALLYCHSARLRIRQITAVGTDPEIHCRGFYRRLGHV